MKQRSKVRTWLHRILALALLWQSSGVPQALAAPAARSWFRPPHEPTRQRCDWCPAFSFLLPGMDQWMESQTTAAAVYSGVGFGGMIYAGREGNRMIDNRKHEEGQVLSEAEKYNRGVHGEPERKVGFGSQLYMSMGSFSVYHGFRTAVATRQPYGQYRFLTREETPAELALAPFEFDYLRRRSTWIPLLVMAGLTGLVASVDFSDDDDFMRNQLDRSDYFFTGATSYMAGTHEEALFRGFMMPVLRESWGSDVWSNLATSGVFAAAHLGSVEVPIVQFSLGWYLGWLTQENEWTLGESIFIHAWWDVFALLTQYQIARREDPAVVAPVVWLPALRLAF